NQFQQDGRASVAHQGQGQAFGGQGAEVHADVDEGLEADPQTHALSDQTGKHLVQCNGLATNEHDAADHPEKATDHDQYANETKFFAYHGQQKVGMGFGQPVQFFDA